MTVRSIIRLEVQPGREAEFERAFVAAGMLTRPLAVDAAFQGELLRSTVEPNTYAVVATWSSPEAYAEWQRRSQEGADESALTILNVVLIDPVPGTLFEVVSSTE